MGVSLQSLTRLVRLLQREIVLTRSRLPPPVCASLHPCRVPTLITPCGIAPHRCIHTTATALAAKNVPPPPPPPSGNDRIALLDAEGADLGVMPRRRAQSLAESLADGVKLRLVLVSRGGRGATPRYQLMTGRQLMEERRRVRVIAKTLRHREPKTVRLASRIEPHDLDVKQRQISDWLRGGHDVTVSIRRLTGQDDRMVSELFEKVTGSVKDLATVKQSRSTERELILQLKRIEPKDAGSGGGGGKPLTIDELKNLQDDNETESESGEKRG